MHELNTNIYFGVGTSNVSLGPQWHWRWVQTRLYSNDQRRFNEFQRLQSELVRLDKLLTSYFKRFNRLFISGVFNEDAKNMSINPDTDTQPTLVSSDLERYLRVQIVNNAIREIFLNQFAHMFSVYEYFFNQPNQVKFWIF